MSRIGDVTESFIGRSERPREVGSLRPMSFRELHEGEPFVIPNPWDAGSAKLLESLGFKALATTSSGFAYTLGRPDGAATLDDVVEHVRLLAGATSLPVSVDLENGYGPPGEAIARVAEAGAAGGSIEDYDRDVDRLYEREEAAERIAEAAGAARAAGGDFVLTGRAENHLHGNQDLDDTIARLQAYAAAGADVLYAPGLRTVDQVRAICDAVDKPVNALGHRGFASVGDLFEAGAQRVSVGGALTWVAVAALKSAAEALRDGDLSVLAASAPKEIF
jgi:2-methylisocitrate lyase-like PEP mutase family enzyme